MQKKNNIDMVISITSLLVIITLIIPLLIAGCYNGVLKTKGSKPFMGWEYFSGTNKIPIESFPASLPVKVNERAVIVNLMPKKIHENEVLLFRSDNQKINVFIGDKKIYEYGEIKKLKYLNSQSGIWNMIELTNDMSRKEIRIEATSPYSGFSGNFNKIYLSSYNESLLIILKTGIENLFIGSILSIAGIFFLILALIKGKVSVNAKAYKNISLFYICISLWIFGESQTMELIINNPIFIYFMKTLSYMLAPVFFLNFLKHSNEEYKRISSFLIILMCFDIIVSILLQVFTNIDIWETLITTNINMLLCGILYLIMNIKKILQNKFSVKKIFKRPVGSSVKAFLAVIVAGIYILGILVDISYFVSEKYNIFGISTGVTTCLLMTYVAIDFMVHVRNMVHTSALLKEEINQNELSLLLTQIKPHFLYNALNSISFLCKSNPQKADEVVVNLAKYLRYYAVSSDNNNLIDFEIELQHIKHYVSIEKVRFPNIDVIFELEVTNFKVPPLTLQPIVENAIKHGVAKKLGGGTVIIKTYKKGEDLFVIISDNGIGFNKDKIDYNTSKGIKNISRRLSSLCNAKIEINSKPEEGTVVIMRIPKINNS